MFKIALFYETTYAFFIISKILYFCFVSYTVLIYKRMDNNGGVKISGFTIIKNAVINDYPIIEAITSILPIVDEMIVLCGDSEDNTVQLIKDINDPKIKIHHSVWNNNLRLGGAVLADETNKAFALINPNATWAFYIQADEVVHEKYLPTILQACKQYANTNNVNGLLFNYLHFYGTFNYIGDCRRWYNKEVRIIRNDKKITSYKDAQGFRIGQNKINVKSIDAYVYHYGWVKSPVQMIQKQKHVSRYWNEETDGWKNYLQNEDIFTYTDYDSLQLFNQTHPSVMQQRVDTKNWDVKIDITRKQFNLADKFLYYFEKITGKRLFDFKNYKIV